MYSVGSFLVLWKLRLLAVPFWIVERARKVVERKSQNLEQTRGGGLGERRESLFW